MTNLDTIDTTELASVTGGSKKDKWADLRANLAADLKAGGYPTPLEAFTKLKFESAIGPNEIE